MLTVDITLWVCKGIDITKMYTIYTIFIMLNILTITKERQYNKYRKKMFSLYGGASNKLSISLNVLAL